MMHVIRVILFLIVLSNISFIASAKIALGIDVLEESNFQILENKKVGLLTNPAGVDSNGKSTVEVLFDEKSVNLVALFGPEHGIYGDEKANEPVDNQIDPRTNLPVYSLYGKYRKPTNRMLEGIDVLVIDLQDIGVRSYTYISCMRLALEACFSNNVEVIILDRPNPLGGEKVNGPIMDNDLRSYVGTFMVPYVHGLTIGELASIAKETSGWLDVDAKTRRRAKMTVIPMKGWTREMTWNQTGLKWIPTSPSIPTLSSALGYAMVGLGSEINGFRHGYGTEYPFRLLSHRDLSSKDLMKQLDALAIPGLSFSLSKGHNKSGAEVQGVYVHVKDWKQLNPTEISFKMMPLSCAIEKTNSYKQASDSRIRLFNKHVGSIEWWNELSSVGMKIDVEKFLQKWEEDCETFKKWSSTYWLYDFRKDDQLSTSR